MSTSVVLTEATKSGVLKFDGTALRNSGLITFSVMSVMISTIRYGRI